MGPLSRWPPEVATLTSARTPGLQHSNSKYRVEPRASLCSPPLLCPSWCFCSHRHQLGTEPPPYPLSETRPPGLATAPTLFFRFNGLTPIPDPPFTFQVSAEASPPPASIFFQILICGQGARATASICVPACRLTPSSALAIYQLE